MQLFYKTIFLLIILDFWLYKAAVGSYNLYIVIL